MKTKLFCFPFAGGTSYSFTAFSKVPGNSLEIVPVELPGRGRRITEGLITNREALIEDIWQTVKSELTEPYAFYGHSMGTLLSFLLTKRIIQENYPLPEHLFVSGCGGPSAVDEETDIHKLPREEFILKLKEMGGSPEEILQDPGLMDFFEPIIRADFEVIETYTYEETNPFDVPVSCFIGTEDSVTYDQAMLWQKETSEKLTIHQLTGNHFFIYDHLPFMNDIFNKTLQLNITNDH